MKESMLIKEIEKLRHKMYRLSHSIELNSKEMIKYSQQLDDLLNQYQQRYAVSSYKNKQQGH